MLPEGSPLEVIHEWLCRTHRAYDLVLSALNGCVLPLTACLLFDGNWTMLTRLSTKLQEFSQLF
ncbi:MAG: hypothetical protein QW587_01830 [Candidatus Bathyarchaeia archaeon]